MRDYERIWMFIKDDLGGYFVEDREFAFKKLIEFVKMITKEQAGNRKSIEVKDTANETDLVHKTEEALNNSTESVQKDKQASIKCINSVQKSSNFSVNSYEEEVDKLLSLLSDGEVT